MKIKFFLQVLLVIFFISCEDKATNSNDVSGLKEDLIIKSRYDRNTMQIRFEIFDGDWDNDGTQDWGDGSNLPSSEPPVSSGPPNPNDTEDWEIGRKANIYLSANSSVEIRYDENLAEGLDPERASNEITLSIYNDSGVLHHYVTSGDTFQNDPPNNGEYFWLLNSSVYAGGSPDTSQAHTQTPFRSYISNINPSYVGTSMTLEFPYIRDDGTLTTYYWEGLFDRWNTTPELTLVSIEEGS